MGTSGNLHPIRVVARRTGTTETTLRAWERRYHAVTPKRADTGRRLYSDRDIERLRLIRRAVDAGRSVSTVASLSDTDLQRLVDDDTEALNRRARHVSPLSTSAEVIETCLTAIERMDASALRSNLNRAMLKFPALELIDDVIGPLLHRIGVLWHDEQLMPRHEHMASSVIRTILAQIQSGVHNTGRQSLVVGTPPGQIHDMGTLFIASLSVSEGWNVVNLGADIPASDIASAASEVEADIVALSLVHPPNDPRVEAALEYLSAYLDEATQLVVGGQAVSSYANAIEGAGGTTFNSSREFVAFLSKRAG